MTRLFILSEQKKGYATPPAPQHPLRRFQFFTGPEGKRFSKQKIQSEMQHYAYTKNGRNFFKNLMANQKAERDLASSAIPSSKGSIAPSKSFLGNIASKLTKRSQRGS